MTSAVVARPDDRVATAAASGADQRTIEREKGFEPSEAV